jgi:hypothetical protein
MPGRTYTAGNFQLLLNGAACGFLKSIDGGTAIAEVVAVPGSSHFAKKHLGGIAYSPLALQLGTGMGKELYEWISASWNGNSERRDGAIVAADSQFVAVSQREFAHALVSEVTIPALDGASKEAAYLTVKLVPEYVRAAKASSRVIGGPPKAQKAWLASNFRVKVDGLDCTRVTAVESFTVKVSIGPGEVGDRRQPEKESKSVEFPNLKISLAESSADSWFEWFDDFVIKGNNDDSKERNGSLTCLSADLATELLRIDFFNLGIFRIDADKAEAGSDRVATVSAHLYCERMEFHAG